MSEIIWEDGTEHLTNKNTVGSPVTPQDVIEALLHRSTRADTLTSLGFSAKSMDNSIAAITREMLLWLQKEAGKYITPELTERLEEYISRNTNPVTETENHRRIVADRAALLLI